ncbi:hypothetical protein ACHHYP_05359 [Achlya hypogyna]|uniref:Glyoxalase/fosfomycin resistance/dioxygenase domain-containing protein n=1 Tax=Achlya hypogyna TaxID=1202772 RepID=A0A1V9YXY1_ACHHY|nr:hypothetical protein ACHHYP_05359 [Achlya hypogyna]
MSPALPESTPTSIPPFHLAIAVHDLDAGFTVGATSKYWKMLNMQGHQLVLHDAGPAYRPVEIINEHDDVPMPHFGLCLSVAAFHTLAARLAEHEVDWVHRPHIRPSEQWKLFLQDPTGNNLEFKAYVKKAPIAPFHLAVPIHSMKEAKHFYGSVLGLKEGHGTAHYQIYNMWGHQFVIHDAGPSYRCLDLPVEHDDIPMPHYGLCLTVPEFQHLAKVLTSQNVAFNIKPHVRFEGTPGEQWKMFLKDPSGNNLEFKALKDQSKLLAKYD